MIKLNDGYGLSFGTFVTSLTVEHEGEIMFILELRAVSEMDKILDSYTTYVVFEENNNG